jgi:hypothetical protein
MQQIIILPIITGSNDLSDINKLLTLICNMLENKLTDNYKKEQVLQKKMHEHEHAAQSLKFKIKNREINNSKDRGIAHDRLIVHEDTAKSHKSQIEEIQQSSDEIFTAIRFLSYLDFIRHKYQAGKPSSGNFYYCDTPIRKPNREHHHLMAENVTIKKESQKLKITINPDAPSHPTFTQRLYRSFCALNDKTKLLTQSAGEAVESSTASSNSALSNRPTPLEIDDKFDNEPNTPQSSEETPSITQAIMHHMRSFSGRFLSPPSQPPSQEHDLLDDHITAPGQKRAKAFTFQS